MIDPIARHGILLLSDLMCRVLGGSAPNLDLMISSPAKENIPDKSAHERLGPAAQVTRNIQQFPSIPIADGVNKTTDTFIISLLSPKAPKYATSLAEPLPNHNHADENDAQTYMHYEDDLYIPDADELVMCSDLTEENNFVHNKESKDNYLATAGPGADNTQGSNGFVSSGILPNGENSYKTPPIIPPPSSCDDIPPLFIPSPSEATAISITRDISKNDASRNLTPVADIISCVADGAVGLEWNAALSATGNFSIWLLYLYNMVLLHSRCIKI